MPPPKAPLGDVVWDLPPLILYPFNERTPPSTLLDHSKAALMIAGVIPSDGSSPEDLNRRLLAGRYAEVRMLFYLGKDVFRWVDQCLDWAGRVEELREVALGPQSFAELLTSAPPDEVKEKLLRWGVSDYVSIFGRAIGIKSIFSIPPAFDTLSEAFLRNYHRYADGLHRAFLESDPYTSLEPRNFHFCLFASGEYSRLLESQWEGEK